MAPEVRLLSVAEIARRLGVPESTVHYWKNRFAQHLPSQGSGRQKRFRPEAVDVFRVIAEMFSLGHSTQDVMETLGKRFPLNAAFDGESGGESGGGSGGESDGSPGGGSTRRDSPYAGSGQPALSADTALRMAAAIGQEIAKGLAEALRPHLGGAPALDGQPALPALASEDLTAIRTAVDESCSRLDAHTGEVARMAAENEELKAKLSVLESELVRLRKDRRELEKYLLDKIKSMST